MFRTLSVAFLKNLGEAPLVGLLKRIESDWARLHDGELLPLRWRRAFSLRVLCPVHLEAISGESLHMPLIIAILRAFAMSNQGDSGGVIFGDGPVFATGKLGDDSETFYPVDRLKEKLQGFLQEYGEGLPAVLLREQVNQLQSTELLTKVRVFIADSLSDLLQIPEVEAAMQQLAGPVHLTEVDALLMRLSIYNRSIRFDDVEALSSWLLTHIESPYYRFRLHREAGFIHTHKGNVAKAFTEAAHCDELLQSHRECFGPVDCWDLAIFKGMLAIDSCDPAIAQGDLDALQFSETLMPLKARAAFWGTRCQLHRLAGSFNAAVHAGEVAIKLADFGMASEAARDRNYLIHALLARSTHREMASRQADLDRVRLLLEESKGHWAPQDNRNKRRSHLTFCLHYEAELARLEQRAYRPAVPPWPGPWWGHGWYFTLLSCARNRAHDLELRRMYAAQLVTELAQKIEKGTAPDSLFFLFFQVYRIYQAALVGTDNKHGLKALKAWCKSFARQGLPGWRNQLSPLYPRLVENDPEAAEELCDAIPFH